jgi:SPP1 family predicted phage head-tail adaptor
MIIGRMDRRIELQKQVSISDGAGGFKTTWVTQATVWAEFVKPRFDTKEVAGAISSVSLREVKIRFGTDVAKGWRMLFREKIFPIDHTYDVGRIETIMVCKEVVK